MTKTHPTAEVKKACEFTGEALGETPAFPQSALIAM
jgi:hypothetical protein